MSAEISNHEELRRAIAQCDHDLSRLEQGEAQCRELLERFQREDDELVAKVRTSGERYRKQIEADLVRLRALHDQISEQRRQLYMRALDLAAGVPGTEGSAS